MADRQEAANPTELEFNARPEHLAEVRRMVERAAKEVGLGRGQTRDLLTAVDEATANAIRHGSPEGEKSRVQVTCHPISGGLSVAVRDSGAGFNATARPPMPGPEATGGRGLPLMCALADTVEISSTPHGSTVVLKKSIGNTSDR